MTSSSYNSEQQQAGSWGEGGIACCLVSEGWWGRGWILDNTAVFVILAGFLS